MYYSLQAFGITDFVITWSLHRSHLNKGCTQCNIGILVCVTFSIISILRSDKWNPLKNSRDSWFGAQWRGAFMLHSSEICVPTGLSQSPVCRKLDYSLDRWRFLNLVCFCHCFVFCLLFFCQKLRPLLFICWEVMCMTYNIAFCIYPYGTCRMKRWVHNIWKYLCSLRLK